MIRLYLDAFWNEAFWLPSNLTWIDLEPSPGKVVTYTDYRYILLSMPMGLVFILLRFILDKYVFVPFGKVLGIKDGRNMQVPPNDILEAAYKAKPASKKIYAWAKKLDMSERRVEQLWRLRQAQAKPSTLVKFCDTTWRCTFFFYNFSFGVYILWDKDWLWDIDQCFIGYPHQGITQDVWWYYIVASAFYWSQTLTLFWNVRRKDFLQMVIHHLATLALLSFSWVCNLHRMGTLFLLYNDGVETLLEAAKSTKYAGYQKTCVCIFALFTFLWIVAKLWIYPYYIFRSIMFRAPIFMPIFPAYYMLLYLCYVLMALNLFWTWLILQLAFKTIKTGQVQRDIRSSSSESDSSQSDHDKSGRVSNNRLR